METSVTGCRVSNFDVGLVSTIPASTMHTVMQHNCQPIEILEFLRDSGPSVVGLSSIKFHFDRLDAPR